MPLIYIVHFNILIKFLALYMNATGDQNNLVKLLIEGIGKADGEVIGGLVEDDKFAGFQSLLFVLPQFFTLCSTAKFCALLSIAFCYSFC